MTYKIGDYVAYLHNQAIHLGYIHRFDSYNGGPLCAHITDEPNTIGDSIRRIRYRSIVSHGSTDIKGGLSEAGSAGE